VKSQHLEAIASHPVGIVWYRALPQETPDFSM